MVRAIQPTELVRYAASPEPRGGFGLVVFSAPGPRITTPPRALVVGAGAAPRWWLAPVRIMSDAEGRPGRDPTSFRPYAPADAPYGRFPVGMKPGRSAHISRTPRRSAVAPAQRTAVPR